MYLKRLYDRTDPDQPRVCGVRILRAKTRQHFSPGLVQRGGMEGWLTLAQGRITVHCASGHDVVYRVVRSPGHYCCHCGVSIADGGQWVDAAQTETRAAQHVRTGHAGAVSPDPAHPAGYCWLTYFEGEREGADHG